VTSALGSLAVDEPSLGDRTCRPKALRSLANVPTDLCRKLDGLNQGATDCGGCEVLNWPAVAWADSAGVESDRAYLFLIDL
jgi:hypothetical protein